MHIRHDSDMPDSRSILTRLAPPPDLTVRYGPLPEHVADVRLPATETAAPLVVVIHGGFWRVAYDRSHTGPQCTGLVASGFAVAAIEYRRTGGGGGWPATFDDVALALDTIPTLVDDAAPGQVDTGRIAYVGHSAGGHLAVWAASRHRLPETSPWRRPGPDRALRGVVSLAGVLDLTEAATANLGDGATQVLIGGEPADQPDRYAIADPARLVPADVPTILIHGDDDADVPVEISHRYAAVAGPAVTMVPLPGVEHFAVIDPESSAWPTVVQHVTAVLLPLDDR